MFYIINEGNDLGTQLSCPWSKSLSLPLMVGFQMHTAFKTTVFFTPENKFPLCGSSMDSILDNTITYQLLLNF